MQLAELIENQAFSPTLIADALRTTKAEIASTLGLGQDALSRSSRLREMVEILHRFEAYTDCPALVAYAWFRSEPLPGFAGWTPDQLVREGQTRYVHAHLDRIMAGGYT